MKREPQTIRVLYCCSTLERGGPVVQLYSIVRHLDSAAFSPAILTLSPEPPGSMAREFDELRVPRRTLGLGRAASFALGPPGLTAAIVRHRPHVVHAFGVRADLFAALCPRRCARVSTRHEPFFHHKVIKRGPVLGTALELIHSGALSRMDRVACVSRAIPASGFPGRFMNTTVIQNGIELDNLSQPSPSTKRALRRQLGLPDHSVIFVVVGCLDTRKDPLTVLRAFRALALRDSASLLFLGDGPLRRACEHAARHMANVHFAGFVDNVGAYLTAADVFVLAALSEGLPMAVLEALAAGLPVVLSRIPPCEEILELEPRAGFLFEPRDSAALARRMDEMARGAARTMSPWARSIVEKKLNGRLMSESYQREYRALAAGHAASSAARRC